MSSEELKQITNFDAFVHTHEMLSARIGDLERIEMEQAEIKDEKNGWFATVNTKLYFSRGSLDFIFVLKKEGRVWKVYSYHEQ